MSDIKYRVLENIKEIRVLNDPYRQEILSWMSALGKPATSKEIATAMKEAPSKVNYHIKVLEKYDFVEIDHTENINGIIAKYYRRSVTNFDFDIKEDDEAKSKQVAVLNMLESMFNNARDKHVRRLKELSCNDENNVKDKGLLASPKVYLNEEEAEELVNLVDRFMGNEKEGRELYNLFISFIKDK